MKKRITLLIIILGLINPLTLHTASAPFYESQAEGRAISHRIEGAELKITNPNGAFPLALDISKKPLGEEDDDDDMTIKTFMRSAHKSGQFFCFILGKIDNQHAVVRTDHNFYYFTSPSADFIELRRYQLKAGGTGLCFPKGYTPPAATREVIIQQVPVPYEIHVPVLCPVGIGMPYPVAVATPYPVGMPYPVYLQSPEQETSTPLASHPEQTAPVTSLKDRASEEQLTNHVQKEIGLQVLLQELTAAQKQQEKIHAAEVAQKIVEEHEQKAQQQQAQQERETSARKEAEKAATLLQAEERILQEKRDAELKALAAAQEATATEELEKTRALEATQKAEQEATAKKIQKEEAKLRKTEEKTRQAEQEKQDKEMKARQRAEQAQRDRETSARQKAEQEEAEQQKKVAAKKAQKEGAKAAQKKSQPPKFKGAAAAHDDEDDALLEREMAMRIAKNNTIDNAMKEKNYAKANELLRRMDPKNPRYPILLTKLHEEAPLEIFTQEELADYMTKQAPLLAHDETIDPWSRCIIFFALAAATTEKDSKEALLDHCLKLAEGQHVRARALKRMFELHRYDISNPSCKVQGSPCIHAKTVTEFKSFDNTTEEISALKNYLTLKGLSNSCQNLKITPLRKNQTDLLDIVIRRYVPQEDGEVKKSFEEICQCILESAISPMQ